MQVQNFLWLQLLQRGEQMAKKKIKDYKSLKLEALQKELISERKELFESNFKHKMGQLKESHLLKEKKKNIARIKTEMRNKNAS